MEAERFEWQTIYVYIFAGCRNKTFFNKATSLKLMNQFEPNLTGIVLCWSLFEKKVLDWSKLQPKEPPLQK